MENKGQREELQNTINRVVEWSLEWQMIFMGGAALEVVKYERDLGSRCTGARANGILGQQLSRAVSYRDRIPFLKLYKVYVPADLENAVVSLSPGQLRIRRCWRREGLDERFEDCVQPKWENLRGQVGGGWFDQPGG